MDEPYQEAFDEGHGQTLFHPPSMGMSGEMVAPATNLNNNNNKTMPPNEQDPGYLPWWFRFLETEDSPLDLIGGSAYMFMLINVRQDIVLWSSNSFKWRGSKHENDSSDSEEQQGGYRRTASLRLVSDSLLNINRRFVAWTQNGSVCGIGIGRLLHWFIGWTIPAIQGWLLYLVWHYVDARVVEGGNQLELPEKIAVGLFCAIELAPHIAQGFGLFLLPFYKKKWSAVDTPEDQERKRNFIRNTWVETKRQDLNGLDMMTIMLIGLIELAIAGAAFWLGLQSAFQQESIVVAILRITVALFVERLDEKVYGAWKLFATPWGYKMARQAVSDFGNEEHGKGQ